MPLVPKTVGRQRTMARVSRRVFAAANQWAERATCMAFRGRLFLAEMASRALSRSINQDEHVGQLDALTTAESPHFQCNVQACNVCTAREKRV